MLNHDELINDENKLREQVTLLSKDQQQQYYALTLKQIKDPDTYAALNWAFIAGAHHFYLGKWLRGLFDLALMCLGVVLLWLGASGSISVGLGLAAIVGVFIIELPQLFNSQNIIHHYNNQVMIKCLEKVSQRYL